ncbi:MAG: hypothetical protein LBC94_02525, partial [Desulfovibrio sp.]|nr:hypothetical protein [Desulfovibrio sp.]
GDVNIKAVSAAEGGALKASGVHGIFSGHGLDPMDMGNPAEKAYAHTKYQQLLAGQYYHDRYGKEGGYYPSPDLENLHKQTEVNVRADGDVNVAVDLGTNDAETVSGVTASYGDVNVEAGGDVNVSVNMGGKHAGSGNVSAVTIRDGIIDMKAEGDINLGVKGAGQNLSVISTGGHENSHDYYQKLAPASQFSAGEELTLTGRAGESGAALDNSIAGIQMNVNAKAAGIVLEAGERVTVDVAARDNGGRTEAVGIQHDRSAPGGELDHGPAGLSVGVDAPEFVIKAAIKDGAGDSRATGISAVGGQVSLANSSHPPYQGETNALTIHDNAWGSDSDRSVESVKIDVSGGRLNTGVEARSIVVTDDYGSPQGLRAEVAINARELDIDVRGGAMAGATASYGINAESGMSLYADAQVDIHTDNLNITVADADRAVGLRADGNADINIYNTYGDDGDHALSVVITCTTINDLGELARGLAVEAVNGGHVSISGNEGKDTIILNGDMLAKDQYSSIDVNTGGGDDRIEIHGGITASDYGKIHIDAGQGDDIVSIEGEISGNGVHISGGWGYDTLILTAPDADTFTAWYHDWLTTCGTDFEKMVFNGIDPTDPDFATDFAWLVDVLNNYAAGNTDFTVQYNYNGNVYGGAYNDFLDSGADGAHRISGGDGNDVMVYHAGNALDGGEGLDALLVSTTANPTASLEGLLGEAANTEVAIGINGEATWSNLASMGISMGNDGLHLTGDDWSKSNTNGAYTTYTNSSGATVVVDTSMTDIDVLTNDILIKSQ